MIKRVYGKADNYELEFKEDGGFWRAAVPADLTDGKYVCEFWAIDDYGFTAYYTGILYMFDGQAAIELTQDDIYLGFYRDDLSLSLCEDKELLLMGDTVFIDLIGAEIVGDWCG